MLYRKASFDQLCMSNLFTTNCKIYRYRLLFSSETLTILYAFHNIEDYIFETVLQFIVYEG